MAIYYNEWDLTPAEVPGRSLLEQAARAAEPYDQDAHVRPSRWSIVLPCVLAAGLLGVGTWLVVTAGDGWSAAGGAVAIAYGWVVLVGAVLRARGEEIEITLGSITLG